jgi:hypothetical protein
MVREINEMWQFCGNPLLTMGFGGCTGVNSNAVANITETAEDSSAYKNCVDPGENSEDVMFLAKTLMAETEIVEKESHHRRLKMCMLVLLMIMCPGTILQQEKLKRFVQRYFIWGVVHTYVTC